MRVHTIKTIVPIVPIVLSATKTTLLCAAICMMAISCQKSQENKTNDLTPSEDTNSTAKKMDVPACYAYKYNKDTIEMQIMSEGQKLHGTLTFNLNEKDKNTGEINGNWKGDTLFATYSFMSEGTNSKRDVLFLKQGSTLVEGHAPMEEKDGKMIFQKNGEITFDKLFALKKVDCEEQM